MNHQMRVSRVATVLIACASGAVFAQNATYTPVPAGFDFPAAPAGLLAARDAQDVAKMRAHAWMVFAGMTQPAHPEDPLGQAIWETWYRGDEIFATGPQPQGVRQFVRKFVRPRQFQVRGQAVPQDVGVLLATFTLFNQQTKDHIRDPQNKYYLASTLDTLNASFPSTGSPDARKIKDFPSMAMSLKSVWIRVAGTGKTGIPIWDPESQQMSDPAPSQGPDQWKRQVVVDPSRDTIPANETMNIPNFPKSHVVPLNAFYHFKVTASQVATLSQFGAGEGDYMILVALHYTTKEIPEWVWATFWWHDQPDKGEFALGRPGSDRVKGPWRNYLMNVSYDMRTPQESGKPHTCFNPWLEARFKDGVHSNCMTCHQQSVWQSATFLPVTRGPRPANDPLFLNTTKFDFVWAFMFEGPGQ